MADQRYLNILNAIDEHKEYHTSVILTYGANLAFYEQVILSRLWRANSRNNLIFMDADRYFETIDDYRDSIGYVGRRYLVVPVQLGVLQSFHPKFIFLLGTDRSRLLIGSGNLTFNGYGNNLEIFTQLDWSLQNKENQDIFSDTWNLIEGIQERWGHSSQTDWMLQKARARSEWLLEEPESGDTKLVHSLERPLMDQFTDYMREYSVKKLTIISPFLDNQAKAIEQFNSVFEPEQIDLILQPIRAVGNFEALQQLQNAGIPLRIFRINSEDRYTHAKVYLFETNRETFLATGSANCTSSALLNSSESGNFEIMLLNSYESSRKARSIIEGYLNLEQISDLEPIQLRSPTPIVLAQKGFIRLLDIALEDQSVSFKFDVILIPEDIRLLGLEISQLIYYVLPLEALTRGLKTLKIDLPEDKYEVLYQAAISASICGLDENGKIIDTLSNKLWVTNKNELNRKQVFLTPKDEKAGNLLSEMVLTSDEEWQTLAESVKSLVELDLYRIQSIVRGTPSEKKATSITIKKDKDGETKIRIVDEDDDQASGISDIEAEIYRESRLGSWLEIVNTQFPGSVKKPIATPIDRPNQRKSRKKPNPDLGRQFISLVRRYIHSLNNPEFMQAAPAYYLLAYFSIFQRIIWLLFTHDVINEASFAMFATAIHGGFFNTPRNNLPPFSFPDLHNHLRWRYSLQWRDNLTDLYALASIFVLEGLYSSEDWDDKPELRIDDLITHTLACLCCIISPADLLDDIDGIVQVNHSYEMDEGSLFDKLVMSFEKHLPAALKQLTKWSTNTILQIKDTETENEKKLLLSARVSLGIGSERISEFLNLQTERVEHCSELIYWADRIEEKALVNYYQKQLVDLLQQQGDLPSLARALLNQGIEYKDAKDYEKALKSLFQARTIANEISDKNLTKTIGTYISIVKFFME